MSRFLCPRCKAKVERSAVDCDDCGKPIAPVPWYLNFDGVGRKAPDAQVIDYAKRVFPVLAKGLIVFWGLVILAGAALLWKIDSHSRLYDGLLERARTTLEERGVSNEDKEREMNLLAAHVGSLAIIKSALYAMVSLGVVGLATQVKALRVTRRLVGVLSPPENSPPELLQAKEDPAAPDR